MACLILWAASTFAKVAVAPITRTVLALLQSRTERIKKKNNTDTHTDARRGGDGLIRSPSEMWGGKKKKTNKIQKSISGWLHRSATIHERSGSPPSERVPYSFAVNAEGWGERGRPKIAKQER